MGGAGWNTKNGWKDNSDDLSTWFGVSVKPSSGRVFALIMRNNNLNGAQKNRWYKQAERRADV